MLLLMIYVAIAIGVSFLCSIFEAVLLSITPGYLAYLKKQGKPSYQQLKKLKDDVDRPLASILTLNTIAHTIGAASAGAHATVVFGSEWLGVFSAVLTLGILLLSEIIPKTIGATYWRQLASITGYTLNWMVWILSPFIWISSIVTRFVSHQKPEAQLREELSAIATLAGETGELDSGESKLFENILSLKHTPITKVLTPRTVVFRVPDTLSIDDFFAQYANNPFSRALVYHQNKDNIVGFVHKLELYKYQKQHSGNESIGRSLRPVCALLSSISLATALQIMLSNKHQLAMIVDEYGDLKGVVSLEDIFEHMLGEEIMDEVDNTPDLQQAAHLRWEKWKQEHSVIDPRDDAQYKGEE
ncbi:HlyC/CorC family transporter [Shewanella sp. 202IG2-18]|uniref:CNNM domain-containing protein n=1 Tax=Parashewanella hymeniacidonis TaxID=2807618 RepID=UPI0019618442|nr:hemolysin family protein [Parashewanella hymeniacidonis]MBM7074135.1 HlyC/CorC family transporter [Parashewanella hymeniacidonis]